MKLTFIFTPARPLDELALCQWIGQASPGEVLEYYRGFLAVDTASAIMPAKEQKAIRLLARRAAWASDEGFVHLLQRRIGPGEFAYLAIKRPRGFVAPPAIDPDGGAIGDLRVGSTKPIGA